MINEYEYEVAAVNMPEYEMGEITTVRVHDNVDDATKQCDDLNDDDDSEYHYWLYYVVIVNKKENKND